LDIPYPTFYDFITFEKPITNNVEGKKTDARQCHH
jgi:hypothetical protein